LSHYISLLKEIRLADQLISCKFSDNELTSQQTQPSKNSNMAWGVLGDFFGGGFFYAFDTYEASG
jgi:hypothetical protein